MLTAPIYEKAPVDSSLTLHKMVSLASCTPLLLRPAPTSRPLQFQVIVIHPIVFKGYRLRRAIIYVEL